jgi:hypothetical protein
MPTGKRRRTTIGDRVERVAQDTRANRQDNRLPITSEDFGNAGRQFGYLVTGDESILPGIPHHSKRPKDK